MNTIEQEYIFVYGTLGRTTYPHTTPHHMHGVLTSFATFFSKAVLKGQMYFISQYPGVIASESSEDEVFGEVYTLTTNPHRNSLLWKIIDEYESADGTPDALYVRKKASVVLLEEGTTLEVWVYFYNHAVDKLERIITGDYSNPLTA